jgi:hypothetical protein
MQITNLITWLNNNDVAVLGVVLLASRIWSHVEHRFSQRQSAANGEQGRANGRRIEEVYLLTNSRMDELLEAAKSAAHARGREQGRDEK